MDAPRVETVISSLEDLALACFEEESGTRSYLAFSCLFFPIMLFIYFLAVLGLCCFTGFFSSWEQEPLSGFGVQASH